MCVGVASLSRVIVTVPKERSFECVCVCVFEFDSLGVCFFCFVLFVFFSIPIKCIYKI